MKGMYDKYIVIKTEDLDKLSNRQMTELAFILKATNNNNDYLVVNKDEPYSDEVEKLILDNSSEV